VAVEEGPETAGPFELGEKEVKGAVDVFSAIGDMSKTFLEITV
jgi:hypothetical protein